jgi:hypothetical protein
MPQQDSGAMIGISGRWWAFPGAQDRRSSLEIEWGNDGKLRLHYGVGSVVEGTELTDAEIEQLTRENLLADVLELASAKLRSGESWDAATTADVIDEVLHSYPQHVKKALALALLAGKV